MKALHTTLKSALLLVIVSFAAPAMAQIAPFDAEVDCTGIFAPGDRVPFTMRFENQTLDTIPLDVTLSLTRPDNSTVPLRQFSITLEPNQDRTINRRLRIRRRALLGDYTINLSAAGADIIAVDTCSFDVM